MYESFYGLSGKPFSLLPDAAGLYMSEGHRRIVNVLDYGQLMHAGFVVVTGDVGAGKTSVIRRFLKTAGPSAVTGVVTNPGPALGSLFGWIAYAFDLDKERAGPRGGAGANQAGSSAAQYGAFVDFLLAHYARGKRVVLVIDEAQNLTAEMLEDLRMLSNVNNERDLLLQIVLVGQPELLATLKRPELRQFVQRISVHCHLGPLKADETAAYIRHRLGLVGGAPDIFDDRACAAVYHFTEGVPRLINMLCDQALVYGYAVDMPRVSFDLVAEVVMDRSRFGLDLFRNVPATMSSVALIDATSAILAEMVRARQGADGAGA